MAKSKVVEASLISADVQAIIDVPTLTPEHEIAKWAGASVVSWLKAAQGFFRMAGELEVQAKGALDRAKVWPTPTNGESDRLLQDFIRKSNEEKRFIESHWSVTSTVHKLHRSLTARRDVGVKAYEDAVSIGNRLHNEYTVTEQRRAREEQERLQRAEEERARAERERVAAEAEAEAVRLEEGSDGLSAREQQFVALMVAANLSDYSGVGSAALQAARTCGFKDVQKSAARLLTLPKIQAAIKAAREAIALRQQATARRAQPLETRAIEVRPDVETKGSRTTWKAELFDEQALVAALLMGSAGIPDDLLMINRVKLNEYAVDMHERINVWPGCRAVSTTKVV